MSTATTAPIVGTLTEQEVQQWLKEPEGETLELLRRVVKAEPVAELMAAFANTHGGKILIGLTHRRRVVGCDPRVVQTVFDKAGAMLAPAPRPPAPRPTLTFVQVGSKTVAVIQVERIHPFVSAHGTIFKRCGREQRSMPKTEWLPRLTGLPPGTIQEFLGGVIDANGRYTDDVKDEIKRQQGIWPTIRNEVIRCLVAGGLAGTAGYVAALMRLPW